jgi:hypothetical protein
MSALSELQWRFSRSLAELLIKAYELGYTVQMGETYRTPQQAAANAATGAGISNSLHIEHLAVDLNLFKDGRYITDDEGHKDLGAFWKSLASDHRWGGDFTKRKDYNHYSITPDGVRG